MICSGIGIACLLASLVQPLAAVEHLTRTSEGNSAVNALSTRVVSNLLDSHGAIESLCTLEHDVRLELDVASASSVACGQTRNSVSVADSAIDFVSLLRLAPPAAPAPLFNWTSKRQRRHKAQSFLHSRQAAVRRLDAGRRVAWISGYARSATSTVLSMINAAAVEEANRTLASPIVSTLQTRTLVRHLQSPSSPNPVDMVDQMLDSAENASLLSNLPVEHGDVHVLDSVEKANLDATMLSKVSDDTIPGLLVEAPPSRVFALFEPCHEGDQVADPLRQRGCGGLLSALAHCDFSQVVSLHGFRNPHTSHHDELEANPVAASALCSAADLVTIKTIEYAHDLREALPVLDADPSVYMIDVVRDPRGIYASWKNLEPFATFLKGPNATLMSEVCRSFAGNINVTHSRLRRIVLEDLVKAPETVMRETYNFLGLPFGRPQLAWIASTFDAVDCQQKTLENHLTASFSDCKANSTASSGKWRQQLSPDELELFASDANCQEVALAYNFDV